MRQNGFSTDGAPAVGHQGVVLPSRARSRAKTRALGLIVPAAAVLCLAVAGLVTFPDLGARALYTAGEVRCALIAREMLDSGDWIQPRLNHVRYYEKPPLMYWAIAAGYEWLGVGELAARLPAALAHLGTVLCAFSIGFELMGLAVAWRAALVFATTPIAFHLGRFASLDTVMTFFLSMALLGLVRTSQHKRNDHLSWLLFWGGMGGATLTKGLVALLFPLGTALAHAIWTRDRATMHALRPAAGVASLAAIVLPWHIAIAWRDPSFLPFYILNEHIYRFLNIREPIDYEPLSVTAFWLSTILWSFPWSFFWPAGLARIRQEPRLVLPVIWSACVLGFFTLARSRLEYYGQPAIPALAVVIAAYWTHIAHNRSFPWGAALPGIAMVLLGIGAAYPVLFRPGAAGDLTALVSALDGYYREYFTHHPDQAFFFARQALQLGLPFIVAWTAIGLGSLAALYFRRPTAAFVLWASLLLTTTGGFDRGLLLIVDDRSQREGARIVNEHWVDSARLVVAGTFEDTAGIVFYTGHPAYMIDAADGDLLFGYRKGDAPDLFLDARRFAEMWHSPTPVFLFTRNDLAPKDGKTLLEAPRYRLLSNHEW
jgi:hypothetical protein